MIIKVDSARCTGHARCNAIAPEVYVLDDDGYCDSTAVNATAAQVEAVRLGAANCPERAIQIEE